MSGRNLPDTLAKLRRLRLHFAFREQVWVVLRASIIVLKGSTSQWAGQLCEIVGILYDLFAKYGPIYD